MNIDLAGYGVAQRTLIESLEDEHDRLTANITVLNERIDTLRNASVWRRIAWVFTGVKL